jgi:hypothetical protein
VEAVIPVVDVFRGSGRTFHAATLVPLDAETTLDISHDKPIRNTTLIPVMTKPSRHGHVWKMLPRRQQKVGRNCGGASTSTMPDSKGHEDPTGLTYGDAYRQP